MADAQTTERLIRWFIAAGGVIVGAAGTVAVSWVTSKIHIYHENRKAHLDDLRTKVLIPLREGLSQHLKPLLFRQVPLVSVVDSAEAFNENAKVTDEPTAVGSVLAAAFAFGAIFASIEPALLEDAKAHHFPELITALDALATDWTDFARDCQQWVSGIAVRIPDTCGLPVFIQNYARPYVMNIRLALFVYLRLFRFPTSALEIEMRGGNTRILTGASYALALGSTEQVDALVDALNAILEGEGGRAGELRRRMSVLQERFEELSAKLDLAIASRKLRRRCDLVSFF